MIWVVLRIVAVIIPQICHMHMCHMPQVMWQQLPSHPQLAVSKDRGSAMGVARERVMPHCDRDRVWTQLSLVG